MKNADMLTVLASLAVLGILLVFWIRISIKRKQARSWPISGGTVESATIVLKTRGGEPGAARHVATVAYSYSVQGNWYSGSFKREFMLYGKAEKWAAAFPTGAPLMVRYNPAKSQDSLVFEDEQGDHSIAKSA